MPSRTRNSSLPKSCAKSLQSANARSRCSLHVGPHSMYAQAHIPGAEYIGAGSTDAGQQAAARSREVAAQELRHRDLLRMLPLGPLPQHASCLPGAALLGFTNVKVALHRRQLRHRLGRQGLSRREGRLNRMPLDMSSKRIVIYGIVALPACLGLYVRRPPHCRKPQAGASGKVAPDFTVTDLDGRKLTLSDYKGKVVLLDFWATWCGALSHRDSALRRDAEQVRPRRASRSSASRWTTMPSRCASSPKSTS